ncbi:MAG: hypothetical protein M3384_20465, partial [Acidobacteriota bacterium]|nr:hypothetical protein [Acidobacteriota bacterium]
PRAVLDGKRNGKILSRLREGYAVEDLKAAISGCRASPWHNGTDPKSNGTIYDSIDLIFRDAEKVDFFIAINKNGVKENDRDSKKINANGDASQNSGTGQASTSDALRRIGAAATVI